MMYINPYLKIVHPIMLELDIKVVYIGGAIIPLYVKSLTRSHDYRETLDIDIIVLTLSEYWDLPDFEQKLSTKGISPSMDKGDPRCRYVLNDAELGPIKIDFLSVSSDVHGFPCDWFEDAVKNTEEVQIYSDVQISIPQIPYIMALKLKAFFDRGVNTFDSKDLQDIVLLLTVKSNRDKLRLKTPNVLVYDYIWDSFRKLALNKTVTDFIENDFINDEANIARDILRFINKPNF